MKKMSLNEMTRGWFVGGFEPTAYKTKDCEVAVKRYVAGDMEDAHMHKVATELTVVVAGSISMNDTVFTAQDIVVVEPFDVVHFRAITDATCVVVKLPGALDDKHVV